jgi:hypothetical protein
VVPSECKGHGDVGRGFARVMSDLASAASASYWAADSGAVVLLRDGRDVGRGSRAGKPRRVVPRGGGGEEGVGEGARGGGGGALPVRGERKLHHNYRAMWERERGGRVVVCVGDVGASECEFRLGVNRGGSRDERGDSSSESGKVGGDVGWISECSVADAVVGFGVPARFLPTARVGGVGGRACLWLGGRLGLGLCGKRGNRRSAGAWGCGCQVRFVRF